jgi:hypothetical protein
VDLCTHPAALLASNEDVETRRCDPDPFAPCLDLRDLDDRKGIDPGSWRAVGGEFTLEERADGAELLAHPSLQT